MRSTQAAAKARSGRGMFIANPAVSSTTSRLARTMPYSQRTSPQNDTAPEAFETYENVPTIALDRVATTRVMTGGQSSTLDTNSSILSLEQNSTIVAEDFNKKADNNTEEVEVVLASLRPIERWAYLAREQKSSFAVFALATIAWLYSVMASWAKIEFAALSVFSTAVAQDANTQVQATGGSMLNMQDVLLILLSIFVVWSLGTVTFASSADKIKQAGDTLKTILGFVVGFFSSGKSA